MRKTWLVLLAFLALSLPPFVDAQDPSNDTAETPRTGIDASRLLLTLAAIIGLGFAGFLVFDRFRLADTVFLIGFGILLAWFGFLDAGLFRSFQPLVAAFAVLIIMFDAGLDLRFGDLAIEKMRWAIVFSLVGFLLTTLLVAVVAHYLIGSDWILSLILGCAVTDTAGLVILPILSQLGVPSKVRTLLLVDTSLPDAFAITGVILLMNVAQPQDLGPDFGSTSGNILGGIASTLLLGFLAGAFWIRALAWLASRRYAYMTTLAMVLALNWGVDAVGGSGPIAVLLFGLIIGNRVLLGKWSDVGRQKVFRDMTQFNGEVAFLVRSFFFVYLGVILDVDAFTEDFVLVSLGLLAAIVIARVITVYAMTVRGGVVRNYRGFLVSAIPRGTTAAVLTTLPAARGITGAETFAGYAVVVILLTNLFFTVGLYLFFRDGTRPASHDAG